METKVETYSVCVAVDVPHYASINIDAGSPEEAEAIAKRILADRRGAEYCNLFFEAWWEGESGHRIVDVSAS